MIEPRRLKLHKRGRFKGRWTTEWCLGSLLIDWFGPEYYYVMDEKSPVFVTTRWDKTLDETLST
jgi:hypothetical protein